MANGNANGAKQTGRSVGELVGIGLLSIAAWELGRYLVRGGGKDDEARELEHATLPQERSQEDRLAGLRSRLDALEADHRRYMGER